MTNHSPHRIACRIAVGPSGAQRRKAVGAFLAAVALAALGLIASPAYAEEIFEGKIVGANEGQVELMVGTESKTFGVDAKTMITLDGKPAKVTDLKAGDSVRLTAELAEGAGMLATKIVANRMK